MRRTLPILSIVVLTFVTAGLLRSTDCAASLHAVARRETGD